MTAALQKAPEKFLYAFLDFIPIQLTNVNTTSVNILPGRHLSLFLWSLGPNSQTSKEAAFPIIVFFCLIIQQAPSSSYTKDDFSFLLRKKVNSVSLIWWDPIKTNFSKIQQWMCTYVGIGLWHEVELHILLICVNPWEAWSTLNAMKGWGQKASASQTGFSLNIWLQKDSLKSLNFIEDTYLACEDDMFVFPTPYLLDERSPRPSLDLSPLLSIMGMPDPTRPPPYPPLLAPSPPLAPPAPPPPPFFCCALRACKCTTHLM